MTSTRTLFILFASAICSGPLSAQISYGGEPMGTKAEKLGLGKPQRITFPGVDVNALMAEDAARAANGVKGPFRFGFNHSTDLSLENSGTWSTLDDGTRLWRLELKCPEAFSINFVFGEYTVPEGARVFVYNQAGEHLGAFTQASSGGRHELGVLQLAGDVVTVEYQEPAALAGQGHLRINQVTHAYRDVLNLSKGLGDSGACNNNTICPVGDPWQNEISAVAMITVGGSGLCTGTLINNCANDGTPYFLTANHCTQGENVSTWGFRFNWESPTCTPTQNGPTNQTVSGATLLVNNGNSDVALLQLNTTPPASYAIYYAGWDATGTAPTSQTCIHHPSGDIKKISFDNNAATMGTFGGAQCWHILGWDDGTTEPGSSGSGLWDQDHHLIGQLFGGEADCSNNVNDYFGRFNVSYPLLDTWLGTCANVLDGYDPNAPVTGLDASILSISGIDASYCNESSIEPSITIKCVGSTALTQLTYSYDVDGGAPTTANWSGNLAQGQTETIALGSIAVGDGDHTFHASCSAPNGGVDQNTANDSKQQDFHVSNPGAIITLNITLDDYGSETTWEVTPQGGGPVLYSGGPYTDNASGTVESADMCLGAGCFTLTMHDAYGDGICCGYGNGDFEVVDAFGIVLLDGDGNFGSTVSNSFCTTVGIDDHGHSAGFSIYPNPGDGQFRVAIDGSAHLLMRDALGREVWRSSAAVRGGSLIDLSMLPSGDYSLEATTANGTRTVEQVLIAR